MRAGGKTTFGPNLGLGAARLVGGAGSAGRASSSVPGVGPSVAGHGSRSTFVAAQKPGRGLTDASSRRVPAIFSERPSEAMVEGAEAMLAKPLPMAKWVEATFVASDVPIPLRSVRTKGIQCEADIDRALEYLAFVSPGLAKIVEVVQQRLAEGKLRIDIDWDEQDAASAQLTFQGRIDRASNEFGERIVVPGMAGPDTLLHELFHALPLHIIEPFFKRSEINKGLPALPRIDPKASFRELRQALLTHARAHETISFGAECCLYFSEEAELIRHFFNSEMMSDLYGAWLQDGLPGIEAVFPYYMTHYEGREGHLATMLALVIKVEGRTDLTWDEYEKLVGRYETQELGLLEDYLKRYVTDRGLDVPPDFFSMMETANRTYRGSGIANKLGGGELERLVRASFDALDLIEGQAAQEEAETAGLRDLAPEEVPPEETHADRRTIFAAYAGVVDRMLDNPPASFTHEELASLVSFCRLLPPQMALTLARRLKVYLLEARDLSVMLGLTLYEKGVKDEGGRMVMEELDLETLGKTRETIVGVMGDEFVTAFLEERLREHREQMERISPAFRIWAQDQFILEDGSEIESDLYMLFRHPELIGADGWQRLGSWLIEHPADIDYVPDESDILNLPGEMKRDIPHVAGLFGELKALGEAAGISAESGRRIEAMRGELVADIREPLEALARIAHAGGEHAETLDLWDRSKLRKPNVDSIRGIGLLSADELEDVLGGMPDSLRWRFAVESDFGRDGWWSHPEVALAEIEGALEVLKDLPDRRPAEVRSAMHTFHAYINATLEKMDGGEIPPSDPLASGLVPLIESYMASVDRHHSDLMEMFEDYEPLVFGPGFENWVSGRRFVEPFIIYHILLDRFTLVGERYAFRHAHKLDWLLVLSGLGESAAPYLRRAMDELKRLWSMREQIWSRGSLDPDDDDMISVIDDGYAPHAISIMLQAMRRGEQGVADEAYEFLFSTIPQAYPPQKTFHDDEGRAVGTWGEKSHFMSNSDRIDWALRLERDRLKAASEGGLDRWTGRVGREIDRGGSAIGVGLLSHFSREFGRAGDVERERDMLRLMMIRSLQTLGSGSELDSVKNVKDTVEAVHNSGLSDEAKDELLTEYLETLLGLATAFRGVDLNLLSSLGGILPWRATDAISEGAPDYPDAERVVLRALASVPELVEDRKGKNDRARLGAFAAAGLPLQRHDRWLAHMFSDPDSAPELAGLAIRHDYGTALAGLGLPHPYEVPNSVSTQWAEDFLEKNGNTIAAVLDGGDPRRTDLVLRILKRVLGSELVQVVNDTKERDYYQARVLAGSAAARFILGYLTDRLMMSEMTPAMRSLIDVLFESGPQSVQRLAAAADLIRAAAETEDVRAIFDAATSNLVFSRRTRAKLAELREGGDEDAELRFIEMLLSLHHSRHPGGMVSDFFLGRFMEDADLRNSYWSYVTGRGGDADPLVIVELGAARADYHQSGVMSGVARAGDYMRTDFLDRYEAYVDAVKFLGAYIRQAGTEVLGYADEYAFYFMEFAWIVFRKNPEAFAELIFGPNQELRSDFVRSMGDQRKVSPLVQKFLTFGELDDRVYQFASMLMDAGWHARVSDMLDEVSGHGLPLENLDRKGLKYLKSLLGEVDAEAARLEAEYADISKGYLRDKVSDVELPDFIERQEGLKRDALVWAFVSLDPSQKNTIRAKLEEAGSDEERLLVMGQAAHFEKLLQLASIHPAVPADLQELFSVFQEDVPHRDEIDAHRTLKWAFVDSKRADLEVDLERPIKEGTIGGVYRATYAGEPVVIKLMPKGKEEDLNDSLRIVRDIRRFLAADGYSADGARALDDFLSFYERTMVQEMDLSLEVHNSDLFAKLLSDYGLSEGFIVPEFLDELASINAVTMRPLPSRRLGQLSEEEREEVFARIDEDLIPAMLEDGVFHFDLHPGNIGLADDGRVVLYDVGRVHMLTVEERAVLNEFFTAAMRAREGHANGELKRALSMLGTVRDKEAFKRVDELLEVLVDAEDAIKAVEEIYPRLSEYGFRLGDSYVKLLLMQLTWEGTKEHLRTRANGRS